MEVSGIQGLYYIDSVGYLDDDLSEKLDQNKWVSLSTSPNSRRVQHYGYKYNYNPSHIKNKTDEPAAPFPDFIQGLSEKLKRECMDLGIINEVYNFNQCIVNEYKVGQSISPHIDDRSYGPVIGCYTIGCAGNMVFTYGDDKIVLNVSPNSLYIMSGDARNIWKHKMNPLGKKYGERRISITFRNLQDTM